MGTGLYNSRPARISVLWVERRGDGDRPLNASAMNASAGRTSLLGVSMGLTQNGQRQKNVNCR